MSLRNPHFFLAQRSASRRKVVYLLLLLFAGFSTSVTGETPQLRVYISVDMEGVAGVVNEAQLAPGGFEYEKFRRLMTAEANACIEAAFAAGATKVTVSDSHGNGLSLLPEELNPKARLIRSWPRPLMMMQGIDEGYDAAILIGYHASIGVPGAVRAHTMSSKRFFDVRFGGKHASEALLSAATAGHFAVPVVMVTGDDLAVAEAKKDISAKIEGVVVKRAIGYHAADSVSPQAARALISAGTKAALQRLKEFRPYKVAKPVKVEIAFKQMLNAEILAYLPIVERVDGATVSFSGKDVPEAIRFISFVSQYSNAE
ncbi:M55 family metallopeptidase [Turneriella parva]|uniref:Peptidase M55 D-aminopeptidase n=1 Tax=Turneriella parva (strain ATCC BAA-1111 / DSM 21527 / NCTC 11395 / H) TaxID=869212 RepID=I4BAS0_TURPD|nr:M55 family metallopeptidase [Turneriella parva]AFM14377.1 peptidase M55 D-aminopeptidase [Turneriella parva DSM 21527]